MLAGILKLKKSDSAALQKSSFDSWLLRSNWVRKRLQSTWHAGMDGWTRWSNASCSVAKRRPGRAGAQPAWNGTVHWWCATVLWSCWRSGLERLDSPHIQLNPSTPAGATWWTYGQLGAWQKREEICLKSRPLTHKAWRATVPFAMKTGISWPLCHVGTRFARSATKADSFGNVPCVAPTWRVQPVLSLSNDWHTLADKDPPKWKICGNWNLYCMLSIFRCGWWDLDWSWAMKILEVSRLSWVWLWQACIPFRTFHRSGRDQFYDDYRICMWPLQHFTSKCWVLSAIHLTAKICQVAI